MPYSTANLRMETQIGEVKVVLLRNGVALFPQYGIVTAAVDAAAFLQLTLFESTNPIEVVLQTSAQLPESLVVLFLPNLEGEVRLPWTPAQRVMVISHLAQSSQFPVVESATLSGICFNSKWDPLAPGVQVTVGNLQDPETRDQAFGISDTLLLLPLLGSATAWPLHPVEPVICRLSELGV